MVKHWPLALGTVLGLFAVFAGLHTGADQIEGWRFAARWTARAGFPVFILTYAASSLLRTWPNGLTKALVRDRRWWGLGFAVCHTIHLGALVTYLTLIGDPPTLVTILGGGLAYALLYAMALTSTDSARKAMGRNWNRLHTVGIHWLWLIFTNSYLGRVLNGAEMPYAGFALTLALLALGLRISVWLKARKRRSVAV